MTRDEARKLLSGYATGSLTELEKQLLFDAALDDQELFDELAEEQAVKELVELPGAKRRLLAALGPAPRQAAWWPWAAGVAVAATVAVAVWVGRPGADVSQKVAVQTLPVEVPAASDPVRPTPAAPPPAAEVARATEDLESAKTEVAAAAPAEVAAPSKETDAFVAPQAPPQASPQPKTLALADRAKSAARDDVAPVPTQLEARAKQQLPILVPPPKPIAAPRQELVAGAAPPPPQPFPPKLALVQETSAMSAGGGALTYEVRDTGILRMTPSRSGVLEVTFDGRTLYPSRPVAAGTTVDVSVPLQAKQLRIDYAGAANAPEVAPQSGEISGTLVLPSAPNPRVVIVIPAQRQ